MNRLRKISFIILIFLSFFGRADELPYLSLNLDVTDEISEFDQHSLRKSALQVVLGTNEFELLLNENNTVDIYQLNRYVLNLKSRKSTQTSYNLDFSLLNVSTNKKITSFKKNEVNIKKFQLESRKLLYKVFYGENYNLQKNTFIKKKLSKKIKSDLNEQKKAIKNNQEKLNKKIKKVSTVKINNEDSHEDTELVNKEDKEKGDVKSVQTKRKTKKNTAKISEFESPDLNLKKNIPDIVNENFNLSLIPDSFYAIGFLKESTLSNNPINSSENIDTQTNLTSINVTYLNNIKVNEWNEYFSIGGAISKILSENPYGIVPHFSLYASYNKQLFVESFFVSLDFEYEKISFSSVSSRGSGLKGFSNSTLWTGFGFKYIGSIYGKKLVTSSFFKKSFIGSSDLSATSESVAIDGTKLVFDISLNVYDRFGAGLFYETASFTSSSNNSFSTDHQIIGLRLVYN